MPPAERARSLSRRLQARFRIDLFSVMVERDFERHLAEAIRSAEQDAHRRGQDELRRRLERALDACRADGRDAAVVIAAIIQAPSKEKDRAA